MGSPTLMIQGADDRCDEPSGSAKQERFFAGGYRRVLLDGIDHFPHREAPDEVAEAIVRHLEVDRPSLALAPASSARLSQSCSRR